MNWTTKQKQETPDQRHSVRRYRIELGVALLAYAIVLFLSITWLEAHPDSPWRVAVALAPVVPVVVVLWAWVRQFRRMDERQRRIQLDALALAFGGTALFVITYGFLEIAGLPEVSLWWVWVVMGSLWIVGSFISRRRYR